VSLYRLVLLSLAVCAFGADPNLDAFLKGVEARYNHAQTLEVSFNEAYKGTGQPRRAESGKLALRKPGRMRWDYTTPKGKLFVSDGKYLWLFTPANNRVEKMKMKESEDMRAPLAFLLGKLNFAKEFRNISAHVEGNDTRISAQPVSENLPYTSVEFVVTGERRIRYLKVTGFDKSVLEFEFDQEKLNPALDARSFQFQVPPGAEVVTEAGR
jgi:outer membrane lipoprotein carrier protein